jgi:4-diphosphocytidyl-2-C-methyl-D-erythritol kinase
MVVFPNIKINIGLNITGKRPDGYHNIESVFYPIAWKESLEVIERQNELPTSGQMSSTVEAGKVRFTSFGLEIPGDAAQNLCIKVFNRLEEWFHLPPVDMYLVKSLPIGAGLGGGSADAAFALRALKDYFDLRISDAEAMDVLADIGSDCPFFWKNTPMFVHGRGERMQSIQLNLSAYYIMLINPGVHISTAEAYAGVVPKAPNADLRLLTELDVADWKDLVVNDFESSLFPRYPQLKQIKDDLYAAGACYASMTGSGSTVYGIFKEEPIDLPAYAGCSQWKGRMAIP